jgi:DNA-binding response OmpR family regulator
MVRPFHILVIEDDENDEYMIRHAFQKARIMNEVVCMRDAEVALDYLLKRGSYAGSEDPLPGLITLDLNLPGVSGKDFLRQLSESKLLKSIPIVVLTVSDSTEDILDCYDFGIYAYLKKPLKSENIVDFILGENFFGLYVVATENFPRTS